MKSRKSQSSKKKKTNLKMNFFSFMTTLTNYFFLNVNENTKKKILDLM